MGFKKKSADIFRNLRTKQRLSMRNQHNDKEMWYMHISPMNLLAGAFALILVLFIVVAIAVAYTPILDFIPGYPGNKSRALLIENIVKLDSLNREIGDMQLYSENIALIMAGKNPVTQNNSNGSDSLSSEGNGSVARTAADSVLRSQMEAADGAYSLTNPDAARRSLRKELELIAPVAGVVSSVFDPAASKFGVAVATAAGDQVMAVTDGTVISSSWTPSEGTVIYVQHAGNLVSVYRNNASVIKKIGDRVRGGEVLGYTGNIGNASAGEKNSQFEFELWLNGTPVDPQRYIVF